MRIAIRADSSALIGTGHIYRCLALAETLRKHFKAEVEFLCLSLPGNIIYVIPNQGFKVHILKSGSGQETANFLDDCARFDGLIIDHYDLDATYEKHILDFFDQILVIDDLANRKHICNLLTDPNLALSKDTSYMELLPQECKVLSGPKFALLRNEFETMRNKAEASRRFPKKIETILIFFGGIDSTNETSKALDALDKLAMPNLNVDVVIGAQNPRLHEIKYRIKEKVGYRFLVHVENMAELILNAQLAIGAGGTNSWERLSLGLPSLVISVANNQIKACEDLAKLGCHYYLGEYNSVSSDLISHALKDLIDHSNETRLIGLKAMELIDTHGCMYVAQALVDKINQRLP